MGFFFDFVYCIDWSMLCKRNDPKLNECLMKAVKENLPRIQEEMKRMGKTGFDPLNMDERILTVKRGPLTLKLFLDEGSVSGFTNVSLSTARFEKRSNTIILSGIHKKLVFNAKHRSSGKIFLFSLNSKGTFSGEADNVEITYAVNFNSGSSAIEVQMKNIQFAKVAIKDNILGYWGNIALNEVVNDNWKLFYEGIRQQASNIFSDEFTKNLKPLLSNYSLNELLPKS